MTQEQLANAAGLRQALISELESGKLDARIDTLSRVAIALSSSIAEAAARGQRRLGRAGVRMITLLRVTTLPKAPKPHHPAPSDPSQIAVDQTLQPGYSSANSNDKPFMAYALVPHRW
jgi:transcriptional regulator with XRE-family HTH domain